MSLSKQLFIRFWVAGVCVEGQEEERMEIERFKGVVRGWVQMKVC